MALIACGINHQTAPLAVREQFAFHPGTIPEALGILKQKAMSEVVLLSTCNRTEIYGETQRPEIVLDWIANRGASVYQADNFFYRYEEVDMVRHLMRVASGLDSMVLGEPQVLGQLKQAYELACSAGAVGHQLRQLFPAVFAASKQIRSKTMIGSDPVTLAYVAVQLAKEIFPQLDEARILLMGAGETIELLLMHLKTQGVSDLIIANRTIERAKTLAEPYRAKAIRIGEIQEYLSSTDIIFTATASQLPILGKGAIERAMKTRMGRPLFIADLAVPRDVEPEVAAVKHVLLHNLDGLHAVINQNWKNRQAAAKQAEAIVDIQAMHFIRRLRVMKAGEMIRRFRERVEVFRDKEISNALSQWERSKDPASVLTHLAHSLTNKLLHQPTVKLRQAAYEERLDLLLSAKDIFDL